MLTSKLAKHALTIVVGFILLVFCVYMFISLQTAVSSKPVQTINVDQDQPLEFKKINEHLPSEPFIISSEELLQSEAELITYSEDALHNEDVLSVYPEEKLVSYNEDSLPINSELLVSPVHLFDEVQVPILMYHHFVTDPSQENSLCISPEKFKSDLLALKNAGYETVSFKEILDYVHQGIDLPEKPIIITIDDGYESNYEYAYPILQELGMKATIFVIGWSVGETKYRDKDHDIIPHFSWEEAKEMVESGLIDIQNHTYDMHEIDETKAPYRKGVLQRKDEDLESYSIDFTTDILKLHELINSHLGYEAKVLAYPYGIYSTQSEQLLSSIGYHVTLTTKNGLNIIQRQKPESLFALKRFNVGYDLSSEELVKLIQN